MAVWAKVYAMEVKVEVEWVDDVSMENLVLSAGPHSTVRLVPLLCRHSKEVQSTGYIKDLSSLDL